MRYKIEFQYREPGSPYPEDHVQDENIVFGIGGETIPIPDVGDSVSYLYKGTEKNFKVLSRHFSYSGEWCHVNIGVGAKLNEEILHTLLRRTK